MIHLISRHPQFSCWHPFVDGITLAGLDLMLVWNREDGNAWLGPAYTMEAAKDAQMSPTKPSFFFLMTGCAVMQWLLLSGEGNSTLASRTQP